MSDEPLLINHSFECPKCGSRDWGTEHLHRPFQEWTGHCHGCGFIWMRTDDPKYWKPLPEDEWLQEGEDDAC